MHRMHRMYRMYMYKPPKPPKPHRCVALAALLLAGACATVTVEPLPEEYRASPAAAEADAQDAAAPGPADAEDEAPAGPAITRTPGVVVQTDVVEGMLDRLGEDLEGPPILVSFNGLPLPVFINEVFAEQLGFSYYLDPSLQAMDDPVVLRLTAPLAPRDLFDAARRVLASYGVSVAGEADGSLTFELADETFSGEIPLLVNGRSLPEVPLSHRTIFQYVPLEVVGEGRLSGWLQELLLSTELRVTPASDRGGLLLKGSADEIASALALIEALDQPLLRGRHGAIVEPEFLTVEDMSADLTAVLQAEGYEITSGGGGGILMLPLASASKLVVFANSPEVIAHVERWAGVLDAKRQETIEEAWFDYRVRYTKAEDLAALLNSVLSTLEPTPAATTQTAPADPQGAVDAGPAETTPNPGTLVVDKIRNTLLFRGSGKEWAQLRAIIDKLDRPVPAVMIEVLVAEVTLTNKEESGLEFIANAALDGRYGIFGGTLGAFGLKANGLSLTLNSAGATRAMLNMFYDESRVVIRSRPSLMVKSGGTASIESGNEIPTVTQAADAGTQIGGSTNVLQQVEYRQTGVNLQIEAVVLADGLVDLAITQDLSEARPTAATSLDGSPTILNRSIDTSVTLKSGSSVVLGGLIANSQSGGQSGVPGIGRVPVLGRLFRADTFQQDRTELLILVIPYVVADHREAQALADALRARLTLHGAPEDG